MHPAKKVSSKTLFVSKPVFFKFPFCTFNLIFSAADVTYQIFSKYYLTIG